MDPLRQINADIITNEAVLNFIHEHISQKALERMYQGEDVSHIKDARDLIDSAFHAIKDLYTPQIKIDEHVNQAK